MFRRWREEAEDEDSSWLKHFADGRAAERQDLRRELSAMATLAKGGAFPYIPSVLDHLKNWSLKRDTKK